MKQFCWFVVFFSLLSICDAQVIVDKTVYDLGEVEKEDDKYIDFKLTNASKATIEVLKTETPYGVGVKFSSKSLPPDSTIFVRIKYTPKRKGNFVADVPIWVSSNNKPIVLTIKGKAMSFNTREPIDPPDFSTTTPTQQTEDELTIKVIERNTKQPVPNAKIDVIWDGVVYKTLYSNEQGIAKKSLKKDVYYIITTANAYGVTETDYDYSNGGQTTLIIELGPEAEKVIAEQPITLPDSGQALQDEVPPIKDTAIAVIPEPEVVTEDTVVITSEALPENRYALNNIVFLIDISVSMKQKGKLDLLKASMIELTNLLRDNDKVAIVTYSSKTKVQMKSTYASNKSEIIEVIKSLEASGSTDGAKGVKRAYKVLNKNHIKSGNNQIFISTDGAFNLEKKDKKLLKTVRKNARSGNKISVIGIKNPAWTVKNMKQIADTGNGNYLHIANYENAKSSLVEEVKQQAAKQ